MTVTEAAKTVRTALKAAFPGVKFSVRAVWGDVEIRWTDGPAREQIRAATAPLAAGHVRIDLNRQHSPAILAQATALWQDAAGHPIRSGWLPPIIVRGYRVTEGPAYYQLGVIADRILAAAPAGNGA
jgi:hypothetical protein